MMFIFIRCYCLACCRQCHILLLLSLSTLIYHFFFFAVAYRMCCYLVLLTILFRHFVVCGEHYNFLRGGMARRAVASYRYNG